MLDAYRNTIDDEGESLEDACNAIDYYLTSIVRPHSFVMLDGSDLVAFAFVVVVHVVHYIDPVVVASARKRLGLGDALVRQCLGSLAGAGIPEVGATITDGNVTQAARLAKRNRGDFHSLLARHALDADTFKPEKT